MCAARAGSRCSTATATRRSRRSPGFDGCFNEGDVPNCPNVDGLAATGGGSRSRPTARRSTSRSRRPAASRSSTAPPTARSPAAGDRASAPTARAGPPGSAASMATTASATTYVVTVSPDGRDRSTSAARAGMTAFDRREHRQADAQAGCYGAVHRLHAGRGGLAGVLDVAADAGQQRGRRRRVPVDDGRVLHPRPRNERADPAPGPARLPLGSRERRAMPDARRWSPTTGCGSRWTRAARGSTSPAATGCSPRSRATSRRRATRSTSTTLDEHGDVDPAQLLGPTATRTRSTRSGRPRPGRSARSSTAACSTTRSGTSSATDTFAYRAVTPSRGVAGPPATVRVNIAAPPARCRTRAGSTTTGTGSSPARTATTTTPAIRPGARRRSRATGSTRTATGVAEPFPTLAAGVGTSGTSKGTRLHADGAAGHAAVPEGLEGEDHVQGQEVPVQVQDAEGRARSRRARRTVISVADARSSGSSGPGRRSRCG